LAKKGQQFEKYTEEQKMRAVEMYLQGGSSYQTVADTLGIRNCSQVKAWVKKHRNRESLQDQRGKDSASHPFIGRPRTKFSSIEEERDYLKAQVEFLKKRNPNLFGEGSFQK
jgi:transposase